jgi:hypothetical protein
MTQALSAANTGITVVKRVLDPTGKYWDAPLPEKNGILQFASDPTRRRTGRDYLADITQSEVFQLRVLRDVAEQIWSPNLDAQEDENDFRSNPNHCFFHPHETTSEENRRRRREAVTSKNLDVNMYSRSCEKINVSNSFSINSEISKAYFYMIRVFVNLMEESKNREEALLGFYYPDDPYNLCCLFLVRKLQKLAEKTKTISGTTEIEMLREDIKKILHFVEIIARKNVFWIGAPNLVFGIKEDIQPSNSYFALRDMTIIEEGEFKLGDYLNVLPDELKFLDELLIWSKQHISLVEELRGFQSCYQSLANGTFEIYLHHLYAGEKGSEKKSPLDKEAFYKYFDEIPFQHEFLSGKLSPTTYIEQLNAAATDHAVVLYKTSNYITSGFAEFLQPFYRKRGINKFNQVDVENYYFQPESRNILVHYFDTWPDELKQMCNAKKIDITEIAGLHCQIIGHQHSLKALNTLWEQIYGILHDIGEIGVFKSLPEILQLTTGYIQNIESYQKKVIALQTIYQRIKRHIPSKHLDSTNLLSFQELALDNLNQKLIDLHRRVFDVSNNCALKLTQLEKRIPNVSKAIAELKSNIPHVVDAMKRICSGQVSQTLQAVLPSTSQEIVAVQTVSKKENRRFVSGQTRQSQSPPAVLPSASSSIPLVFDEENTRLVRKQPRQSQSAKLDQVDQSLSSPPAVRTPTSQVIPTVSEQEKDKSKVSLASNSSRFFQSGFQSNSQDILTKTHEAVKEKFFVLQNTIEKESNIEQKQFHANNFITQIISDNAFSSEHKQEMLTLFKGVCYAHGWEWANDLMPKVEGLIATSTSPLPRKC